MARPLTRLETALDLAAATVGLLFALPWLGRAARQIWCLALDLVWRLAGLIPDLLGTSAAKKIRISLVILSGEEEPLTRPDRLAAAVASARVAWREAANVELLVESVVTVPPGWISRRARRARCGIGAWIDDLGLPGCAIELASSLHARRGAWRRLLGWGAPVLVFLVEEVKGKLGCSLSLASDYVAIAAGKPVCIAHELGHSTVPGPHHAVPENLMHSRCGGTRLDRWQRLVARNSRHVTWL